MFALFCFLHLPKTGFSPVPTSKVKTKGLKGNWAKTGESALRKRLQTIEKWHTTSDSLVEHNLLERKRRKEPVSNSSSQKPVAYSPSVLKVNLLQDTENGALRKGRVTTLKRRDMSPGFMKHAA